MNLYELFEQCARRQPDRPAILCPAIPTTVSYRRLAERIDAASVELGSFGIAAGSCVGLHCVSGIDYIILTYAAWRCGACVVPIPTELTAAEKQLIATEVGISHLVGVGKPPSFVPASGSVGQLRTGAGFVYAMVRAREHPPGFAALNPAFVRWTSGTTGAAKGVVLSHETIRDRFLAANQVLGFGPNDRIVWLLSMSYHFAVTIAGYLSLGCAIVLPANHFAAAVLQASRRATATAIYASPSHYNWLAEVEGDLSSVRLAISTTTGLRTAVAQRFHKRHGLHLTQALGIIEVGLPFINRDFAAEYPEAVGNLLPDYEVKWRDCGLGDEAKEILLRGPGMFEAYYQPWLRREETLVDGWFATGDIGTIDASGCVFLCGRTKDVISVLGAKFFPREVEAVLESHPAIQEASVFGVLDPRLGEVASARVVARNQAQPPAEEELMRLCRKQLASFKVPQQIELVQALPRTASGKVLRRPAASPLQDVT